MNNSDSTWIDDLKKHDLFDLDQQAQHVGYYIWMVNSYSFNIKYKGEIRRYYSRENIVKTFAKTPVGKEQARAFLATVRPPEEPREPTQEELDEMALLEWESEAPLRAAEAARSPFIIVSYEQEDDE